MLRLVEAGVSPADLSALFITHHHSDHMIDVADVLLSRWICGGTMPFPVIAPVGPASQMLNRVLEFWEQDIAIRQSHGRRASPPSLDIIAFEPKDVPTVVWSQAGLVVRSIAVHHEPVAPAVAYRIDGSDGSITISGDTRVCGALADLAHGSDVLVHEAMRTEAVLAAGMPHVAAYHADTLQLGRAVQNMAIGTLVLTHLEPSPRDDAQAALFEADVRAGGFTGNLRVADDLSSVETKRARRGLDPPSDPN